MADAAPDAPMLPFSGCGAAPECLRAWPLRSVVASASLLDQPDLLDDDVLRCDSPSHSDDTSQSSLSASSSVVPPPPLLPTSAPLLTPAFPRQLQPQQTHGAPAFIGGDDAGSLLFPLEQVTDSTTTDTKTELDGPWQTTTITVTRVQVKVSRRYVGDSLYGPIRHERVHRAKPTTETAASVQAAPQASPERRRQDQETQADAEVEGPVKKRVLKTDRHKKKAKKSKR